MYRESGREVFPGPLLGLRMTVKFRVGFAVMLIGEGHC